MIIVLLWNNTDRSKWFLGSGNPTPVTIETVRVCSLNWLRDVQNRHVYYANETRRDYIYIMLAKQSCPKWKRCDCTRNIILLVPRKFVVEIYYDIRRNACSYVCPSNLMTVRVLIILTAVNVRRDGHWWIIFIDY